MPSTLSYPGVYIEEIPSGVRTISGVATSVTAFVGYTAKGVVDKPVRIFNYGDYEREFGGLHRDSDVSYAVQQFFMNGGADAYVVRLAAGAAPASVDLLAANAAVALRIFASSAGIWGNHLRASVDYDSANPYGSFNLTVRRVTLSNGKEVTEEQEEFRNLSMNSRSANYVVGVVNAGSRLVRVERPALGLADATDRGFSLGKNDLTAVTLDATHSTITGVLNGSEPFSLEVQTFGAGAAAIRLGLANAILAQSLDDRLEAVRTRADGSVLATGNYVILRSKNKAADPSTVAEFSSVVVTPAPANDASALLGMGQANGGREREGAAVRRPMPTGTTGGDHTLTAAPVGGALTITINDERPAPVGTTVLMPTAPIVVPATAAGPALAAAVQAVINAEANPAAQAVIVEWVASSLRVRLPEDAYPHAVINFAGAGAAALKLPVAAGPQASVQTYGLGEAVNIGGQANAVRGADGLPPSATEYLGSEANKTGIHALRGVDLFNLLCLPGTPRLLGTQGVVVQAAIALCEQERAFLIIDPPGDSTLTTVEPWAAGLTKSRNCAVYFPWIQAADPLDNFRLRSMPPSGAIAGVFARTDAQRGVWKAPAGTEAVLNGTQGLSVVLTDMETGTLNPKGVNVLRSFPVYGRVVWGARTRAGADENTDEYKYVPIRRLALYIEETLFRNTQWVVFEPNDEPLWAQIRLNVGAFMNGLFRQGAFQGGSPRDAYLVKCDAETTTQYDIDRGIVNLLVAFAPLKPAEFVVIRIQQKAQIPA
ncbi:MAG TPA: phage tail sheath subtilisin-like domain-containing protein [Longimicrobium sp.]|nr:phage tail sheath subtilisin-like domain-containing protein [Longimicrobium sp.]